MMGCVVASVIALPWYVNAMRQGLVEELVAGVVANSPTAIFAPYGTSNLLDSRTLMFYPMGIFYALIGPYYSIILDILLAIFGFALFQNQIRRAGAMSSTGFRSVGLAVASGLVVFSLFVDKDVRFILPVVPVLIVLAASIGWKIRLQNLKLGPMFLLGLLLCGSGLTILGLTQPSIGARIGLYSTYSDYSRYHDWIANFPLVHDDWKLSQIIQLMVSLNPKANVAILAAHWVFNQDTLSYEALLMGYEYLQFTDFREYQVQNPYLGNLSRYDFTLLKTGDVGSGWLTITLDKILKELQNSSDPFYSTNRMVGSFSLPDNSTLYIFARTSASSLTATCLNCTPSTIQPNTGASFESSRTGFRPSANRLHHFSLVR